MEIAGEPSVPITIKNADQTSNSKQVGTATKIIFMVFSLLMSLSLWIYIQINTNPVVTRNITVPIQYDQTENLPANMDVSYPIKTVDLEIVGRAGTVNSMTADDIIATIDYSKLEDRKSVV